MATIIDDIDDHDDNIDNVDASIHAPLSPKSPPGPSSSLPTSPHSPLPMRAMTFRSMVDSPSPPSYLTLRDIGWHAKLSPRMLTIFRAVEHEMDGAVVLLLIVLVTVTSIFLDDIKIACFSQNADITFAAIALSFFCLFLLELIVNCFVKSAYFNSFYFYLDLVSAFSLMPDIPWLWSPIIGLNISDAFTTSNTAAAQVARIQVVSATGARLLNILKFVKLIRLGRIAKLFEMAHRTIDERSKMRRRAARGDDNVIHADDYTQSSQVGQNLSEQTTRKVVLLVLLMLFGIPLLQPTTVEYSESFVIGELAALASNPVTLGTVYAVLNGAVYTVANSTTPSAVTFTPAQIAVFLSAYNSNLGQPPNALATPTSSVIPYQPSAAINQTYVTAVAGAMYAPIAIAALTASRAFMEQQFAWTLNYDASPSVLVYLKVKGTFYANEYITPSLFAIRTSEVRSSVDPPSSGGNSVCVYSTVTNSVLAAQYSMWRTVATLILLFLGAMAFEHNNKRMVIEPIERMVATIVQLQKNPLAKATLSEDPAFASASLSPRSPMSGRGSVIGRNSIVAKGDADAAAAAAAAGRRGSVNRRRRRRSTVSVAPVALRPVTNETGMLERTLQKLTGLLQVGFGEAGSRMIQKCMNSNAEGDLDPLVDGNRIVAIFGFCDIRRFTDATECLREDVMMYVNEIAAIVHSHVSLCDGHPNKNVGDAFLVMWRLAPFGCGPFEPDDLFFLNEKQPRYLRPSLRTQRIRAALTDNASKQLALDEQHATDVAGLKERAKQANASYPPTVRTVSPFSLVQLSVLADKSLVSFLRIIVDLDASEQLRAYENDPRIKAAFTDFIVQLGFGLHCGWAIEGPIGSRYKIDASYLSPHVNLSEALQDLTKLYGTPLLVSGEFYTLLSPYMKSFMRRIDVVKVAGRDVPMNLYSFDIHPRAMKNMCERRTPDGYDTDAEIEVVQLRQAFFSRSNRADGMMMNERKDSTVRGASVRQRMSVAPTTPIDGALSSPSPISTDALLPDIDASPAPPLPPCLPHPLFANQYLDPTRSDFSSFDYPSSLRYTIHQSSPVAMYHLVYNFRLTALQCGIPILFYDLFDSGLQLYLDGDWLGAKTIMDECRIMYPEDGPTKVILDVMKEEGGTTGEAPPSWEGWHNA